MLKTIFLQTAAMALLAGGLAGCSVVQINGTHRTDDDVLCVVSAEPRSEEVHAALIALLGRKGFQVRELASGTPPAVCRQTLVYAWRKEQYWLPAVVKQYGIDMDLYVDGQYRANASFEPTRNLVSPHVKFVRFTRYLGRVLDRLFPGRPEVGA
ncbi:MAG: hypothetical protein ACI4SY_02190 [Sutterella sp.]